MPGSARWRWLLIGRVTPRPFPSPCGSSPRLRRLLLPAHRLPRHPRPPLRAPRRPPQGTRMSLRALPGSGRGPPGTPQCSRQPLLRPRKSPPALAGPRRESPSTLAQTCSRPPQPATRRARSGGRAPPERWIHYQSSWCSFHRWIEENIHEPRPRSPRRHEREIIAAPGLSGLNGRPELSAQLLSRIQSQVWKKLDG